jgi:DUF4097 and DUF4098 domain-containing protein YvlB
MQLQDANGALNMMTRGLRVLTLVALCACSGSFDERVHEEFHQTLPAGAAPAVRVDNIAGSVRIDGWAKPDVDVHATKYGYDAQELRSITIGIRNEGGAISIATNYGGGMHRGGVRYRIAVPENASLNVSNVAGTVDVAGVRGDVTVQTQAGTVVADLGTVRSNRSVNLTATTGAIRVTVARDSDASVEAQSTVGAFSSDIPGISASRENVVGARAAGKIGSGSAQIRLNTTTGAIALRF